MERLGCVSLLLVLVVFSVDQLAVGADNPRCHLPPDSGPCYARAPRYFYNSTSQQCQEFIYGGCQGNANRFQNPMRCRQACMPEVVCQQEPASGRCVAYFPSFFYNSTSEKCQRFIFGGCQGNDNRFRTRMRCMAVCGNRSRGASPYVGRPWIDFLRPAIVPRLRTGASPFMGRPWIDFLRPAIVPRLRTGDVCQLDPETGPCRARIPSFFYNSTSAQCEGFIYGGCRGNGNRFRTRMGCMAACGNATDGANPGVGSPRKGLHFGQHPNVGGLKKIRIHFGTAGKITDDDLP